MSDEPEETEGEEEFEAESGVYLDDGTCWVRDPDYLAHDSDVQGVIAMQFRDGALWFLDGVSRKWCNAEAQEQKTKPTKLRTVQ